MDCDGIINERIMKALKMMSLTIFLALCGVTFLHGFHRPNIGSFFKKDRHLLGAKTTPTRYIDIVPGRAHFLKNTVDKYKAYLFLYLNETEKYTARHVTEPT